MTVYQYTVYAPQVYGVGEGSAAECAEGYSKLVQVVATGLLWDCCVVAVGLQWDCCRIAV